MDLFASDAEVLTLQDAEVILYRAIDLGEPYANLLNAFLNATPWQSKKIKMFGKEVDQPRLIAWYGDSGADYRYSGLTLTPNPWTPTLLSIKYKVEQLSGASFNSVLLNYYRDHNDSMGMHSDDEKELGDQPIIASLSLGETRRFQLKHRVQKDLKPVTLELQDGDLLVMKGDTQQYWKHGIPKERHRCRPRVNLTFRNTCSL